MTTVAPESPATPIFDEVDRWCRGGGDEAVPATMLSFTATGPDPSGPTTTSGPGRGYVPCA